MSFLSGVFLFCFCAFSITNATEFRNWGLQEKKTEQLDADGRYILSWTIDEAKQEITFEIWAETTGYVGLGISPTGKMTSADIFVVGVLENGEPYSGDYHATENGQPTLDAHNDWDLKEAWENATHTYARVTRLLNTCDAQDYPILEENTARIIYALGTTDTLSYHRTDRGTKSMNLIEMVEYEFDIEKAKKWDVLVETQMPSADTTYWCTIHRGPNLTRKHHVVGFDVYLDGPVALKHAHHFIIKQCQAPSGADAVELFEPWLNHPGEDCNSRKVLPSRYCKAYLFVWAVGGKRTLFPSHVGFPIGVSDQDNYYMLEAHYDNPDTLEGLSFKSGIQIYYTEELRDNEASLLTVGHDTTPTLIVPPDQTHFVITGHCSPSCSANFPESGLNVFNILLHSHLSGRKLKLRHYRRQVELPWLSYDDTYDFDFQQSKPLRNEVIIMPGDHLVYECVYDSTWQPGQVVLGGLSSREEMCLAFLWVYSTTTPFQIDMCGSKYPQITAMLDFGITKVEADEDDNYLIVNPKKFRGIRIQDYMNWNYSWTPQTIATHQQKHRYGFQETACCARDGSGCSATTLTRYPAGVGEDYKPEEQCIPKDKTTTTTTESTSMSLKSGVAVGIPILVTFLIYIH